jgi:hypothetical protein
MLIAADPDGTSAGPDGTSADTLGGFPEADVLSGPLLAGALPNCARVNLSREVSRSPSVLVFAPPECRLGRRFVCAFGCCSARKRRQTDTSEGPSGVLPRRRKFHKTGEML